MKRRNFLERLGLGRLDPQIGTRPKKLRERLGDRLVAKHVLYQENGRLFWESPADDKEYEPLTKYEIKENLREMILSAGNNTQQALALLNVIGSCNLLNLAFVLGDRHPARGDQETVMLGTLPERILDLRVVEDGFQDGGFEIIDERPPGDAAEEGPGIAKAV